MFHVQQPQQILKMETTAVSENAFPRCLGITTIRKTMWHYCKIFTSSRIKKHCPLTRHLRDFCTLSSATSFPVPVFLRGKKYHDRQIREDAYFSDLSFPLFSSFSLRLFYVQTLLRHFAHIPVITPVFTCSYGNDADRQAISRKWEWYGITATHMENISVKSVLLKSHAPLTARHPAFSRLATRPIRLHNGWPSVFTTRAVLQVVQHSFQ